MVFAPARLRSAVAGYWPIAVLRDASAFQPSSVMPSIRRLKTRRQFLAVASTRQKWVTPGLILQVRRRPPSEDGPAASSLSEIERAAGLGFTVSRKVGNAVARNRARRRLKAAAAEIMEDCALGGRDYVLIGRRSTLNRPFEDLIADLKEALKRIERKSAPNGKSSKLNSNGGKREKRAPKGQNGVESTS